MRVKVKVIGLDKAIQDIEEYKKRKHHELIGVVAETSREIQNTAKSLAPADLGNLRNNITHVVISQQDKEVRGEILSGEEYSSAVEFGTKPHRAPYSAIKPWAIRKGLPPVPIWLSIIKNGTNAHPFMNPSAQKSKSRFIRLTEKVMSRA